MITTIILIFVRCNKQINYKEMNVISILLIIGFICALILTRSSKFFYVTIGLLVVYVFYVVYLYFIADGTEITILKPSRKNYENEFFDKNDLESIISDINNEF